MSQRFLSRVFRAVAVEGRSMLPAYGPGDWLIATPFRRIAPGDVVVIERRSRPGMLLIKRVVRLEGDKWWVEGDNAEESDDSRTWGAVDRSEIVARIRFRYRRA